ncbi:DNA ligase-like [Anneissia japonica]|uniref:DNA ligase-like n=1 Tax=Anneissia japonica TaxID=1529436 RepID=UPI001425560C|nr:DNA ligase-like [Anneissia japonica]
MPRRKGPKRAAAGEDITLTKNADSLPEEKKRRKVDSDKTELKGDSTSMTVVEAGPAGFKSAIVITDSDVKLPGRKQVSYEDFTYLKDKGQPGTQVMLAHKYTDDVDPKGWWMSEKLDGLRAFWNGNNFYSRLGNKFYAPEYFTKNFPKDIQLDGELFFGRGEFSKAVSIVKSKDVDKGWDKLTFEIFDAPNIKAEFEDRIEAVADYFEKNRTPYVHVLEHVLCKGKDNIEQQLKRVETLSGEGLMIREAKSDYDFGTRSKTLLKIKSFYDAEAIVIGYEKGKGRNTGVVGALCCRMECGTKFSVGSGLNDKERKNPPKKGSIITYKFQELTKSGKPRFPTYIGVRIDMDKPKDAVLPAGKNNE